MTDFIIISQYGGLYVWQGRYGWMVVPQEEAYLINRGHQYRTWKRADASIKRMRAKYPNSQQWMAAGYLSLEDARQDDNVLGLKWND